MQRVANPLGIEAWLVEEHSGSAVAMGVEFLGGSSQDPADRRGLTNLLVGLMYEGAGDLVSDAYKARLKDQGIQLGWEFDRDSLWGILITPGRNREEAARLTNLALSAPRYDTEDVERVRGLIVQGAGNRTPNSISLLAFQGAMYPGHIYGVWESGDVQTLTAMTVPDLRAHRQKILARDNLRVVVVGDIDARGATDLVTRSFGGLPAKAQLVAIAEPAPPPVRRIDATGQVPTTSIRFGGPAMKRSDPDYAAANAAAFLLGGRGTGFRLYDALVTRAALAMNVTLALNATDHAAWYAGNTTVTPEKTDAAIALLQAELKRFAEEGPTPDELGRAKASLVMSFLGRFDSVPGTAVELAGEVASGLGADFGERYVDALAALTAADVKRAAQRMFGGGMLVYTLGPATP